MTALKRQTLLKKWLASAFQELGLYPAEPFELELVAGDASFRRYYRVRLRAGGIGSVIVMDSPPDKEPAEPFVMIAKRLIDAGVNVPKVYQFDCSIGVLILSDYGDDQLLGKLNDENGDFYYQLAIDELIKLQSINDFDDSSIPLYSEEKLNDEMGLFKDWYIDRLVNFSLGEDQVSCLNSAKQQLIQSAIEQPQCLVHRDYHSRNIMVSDDDVLGVLDFQDAVIGPITYDIASLFKDCYISWPKEKVDHWVGAYLTRMKTNNLRGDLQGVSFAQFSKWFDLMGLQRHLKVIGIFSRLKIRDNKPEYIKDFPRIFSYVLSVTKKYEEFESLDRLLKMLFELEQNKVTTL